MHFNKDSCCIKSDLKSRNVFWKSLLDSTNFLAELNLYYKVTRSYKISIVFILSSWLLFIKYEQNIKDILLELGKQWGINSGKNLNKKYMDKKMKKMFFVLSLIISTSISAQNIVNTLAAGGIFKILSSSGTHFILNQSTGKVGIGTNANFPRWLI